MTAIPGTNVKSAWGVVRPTALSQARLAAPAEEAQVTAQSSQESTSHSLGGMLVTPGNTSFKLPPPGPAKREHVPSLQKAKIFLAESRTDALAEKTKVLMSSLLSEIEEQKELPFPQQNKDVIEALKVKLEQAEQNLSGVAKIYRERNAGDSRAETLSDLSEEANHVLFAATNFLNLLQNADDPAASTSQDGDDISSSVSEGRDRLRSQSDENHKTTLSNKKYEEDLKAFSRAEKQIARERLQESPNFAAPAA